MIPGALSILWSIATSRVGVALIAGTISWQVAYWRGHDAADQSAKVAALESRIAAKEADLTAARNAERLARDQANILADRAIQNQEIVNDLSAQLAAENKADPATADRCRLSERDAARLRDIDTNAGRGPSRSAPTPLLGDPGRGAGAQGR